VFSISAPPYGRDRIADKNAKEYQHIVDIGEETFEKRPLSPPAFGGTLRSSRRGGTRNIQYIPVVNPAKAGLTRLDLGRN